MNANSRQRLLAKLRNKRYRDAYVAEQVKTAIPNQLFILRKQRDMNQADLAKLAKTTQSVISRLEDPNYGNMSVNSLLKAAAGLDIGLLVRFVPFSKLLAEVEDVSSRALSATTFNEELNDIEEWATREQQEPAKTQSLPPQMTSVDAAPRTVLPFRLRRGMGGDPDRGRQAEEYPQEDPREIFRKAAGGR